MARRIPAKGKIPVKGKYSGKKSTAQLLGKTIQFGVRKHFDQQVQVLNFKIRNGQVQS